MTDWTNNPYYNPQNLGLEIVAEVDLAKPYEFNKIVVWKNKNGNLFWANDSGCSCPTPFDKHTALESLEQLINWNFFEDTVINLWKYNQSGADVMKFLRTVQLIYQGA